jgi:hypothetical protein
MAKIFIGGDSWARGESWEFKHLGLQEYFTDDGYEVINASILGASNHDSIEILNNHLKKDYLPGDIIFWVQSEPLRDLRPTVPPYSTMPARIESAGGIYNLMRELLHSNYITLNLMGANYGTIIHVIGGLSSIGDVTEFKHVNPLVPSWTELLVGNIAKYLMLIGLGLLFGAVIGPLKN